jgi:tetratricopeptide (TPR) repeat protein
VQPGGCHGLLDGRIRALQADRREGSCLRPSPGSSAPGSSGFEHTDTTGDVGSTKEAAAYAEEGIALNRRLAEYPPAARTKLPSMVTRVTGLSISWRAGAKAMEIECLVYLANVRILQGRPQEGMAIAREARAISKELPERMEMMSLWALGMGFQEVGEYEEALTLARRGTERAREVGDTYLLGVNLGRLGEAYEALMDLEEARAAYEEAVERGHYGLFPTPGFAWWTPCPRTGRTLTPTQRGPTRPACS